MQGPDHGRGQWLLPDGGGRSREWPAAASRPAAGGEGRGGKLSNRRETSSEETLLVLLREVQIQSAGLLPDPEMDATLQAPGLASGRRHVGTHRRDPAGSPVHSLLLIGQPGPYLWTVHVLLLLHHLRPLRHLQTHLGGDLRRAVPARGPGGGQGAGSGRIPPRRQRHQQ